MSLTPKQQRFVQEYLIDLNGSAAAVRAGYSQNSAKEIAVENLTKPPIREAIDKALALRADRTETTADFVIQELRKIACAEVEKYTGGDKLKALELLGKHLGMFKEQLQLTGGSAEMPKIQVEFIGHERPADPDTAS